MSMAIYPWLVNTGLRRVGREIQYPFKEGHDRRMKIHVRIRPVNHLAVEQLVATADRREKHFTPRGF